MAIIKSLFNLDRVLEKACGGNPLAQEEILFLLGVAGRDEINRVFQAARYLRRRYFGNKVFFYGFVYFSTYCRNSCVFCFYNKSNTACQRYRKQLPEIIEAAYRLAASGVHLIDLTMGEDPEYLSNGPEGLEKLVRAVEAVKKSTGLPLMISPGVVSGDTLRELKKAGVDWYACYQETHNRKLFNKLRLGQSYNDRFEKKIIAQKMGLLIEEGLLTGVGESLVDVATSLGIMKKMRAEQVRVMSFVPQKGTAMGNRISPSRLRELLIIAVMRLVLPDRLIPASLDVDGIIGLKQRLEAGANVVTSLIPPETGLSGVSQRSLDIEKGNRTVRRVIPILGDCGLTPAAPGEYAKWVADRHRQPNGAKAGV